MKYDEAQEGEGRRSRKQIQLQPGMAKRSSLYPKVNKFLWLTVD